MIPWHRLFGLVLNDFFRGSAWQVVVEMDLSRKLQKLDIVVVRRGQGPTPQKLPDGFAPLADHNLITYKSLREPLDGWAIKELIGHAVNYRKQVSPSLEDLIAEESIRLFAVATRYPQKLAEQVRLERCSDGVYDIKWGIDRIRLLVLSEVPAAEHNAIWNLFSGDSRRIEAAAQQLRSRRSEMSTVLDELLENYQREGFAMPYTMQDFMRDVTLEHLDLLRPDERLKGLSIDERLRGLSGEDLLKGLSSDEIEAYLRKRRGDSPRSPSEQ
ncbi:MAG TPA: hypothetical protein PLF81_20830 [Candidatus Anammoximicrobium sp.]|nr:hypothetical protein [Candidatus Anammoximicrobium sp.]